MQIPPTIFPKKFITVAYSQIVSSLPFARIYLNTILSTVITVLAQLVFCAMAGYAFARIKFPFKNTIFILLLSVLMVPGQIFLIPQYLIIQKMGLLDTIPALFIPNLFSAFGTFLMRQFFLSLPEHFAEEHDPRSGTLHLAGTVYEPVSDADGGCGACRNSGDCCFLYLPETVY